MARWHARRARPPRSAVHDPAHVHVTTSAGLPVAGRPIIGPLLTSLFALTRRPIRPPQLAPPISACREPRPNMATASSRPAARLRARRREDPRYFQRRLASTSPITCGECGKESANDELVLFGHATSDHGAGRGLKAPRDHGPRARSRRPSPMERPRRARNSRTLLRPARPMTSADGTASNTAIGIQFLALRGAPANRVRHFTQFIAP